MKKLSLALVALMGLSGVAEAHQAGDFFMRAGTATVRPSASSDNVLGLGEFNIDNNTQLGLTFDYMVTDNFGVELLAATPFRHRVGLGPTGTIATVRQLPPTLMAQWYFGDATSKLRPYVGAGINYTMFFDNKFNETGKDLGLTNLSVKNSWGAAGQVGMDYMLDKNWMLNMSVWYINIDTKVRFDAGPNNHQSIDTKINPWVFMFGAGYTF
ncbi:outer membrane protein OmpW [Klebsiella sp. BIGb0407]|uniref:outer membrane protein OmpW n=1 Tax=Klebsiella sp. BIGb0407 TaxID=2940603 RepID=UPI0021673B16|nr:outer membrane protein OmpW [Klebsiella sp. BIGb0407]MCS3430157.1 outer membrane protein [Klebsiella sp. BIGb0407]